MTESVAKDFRGVPYVVVDKEVERVVILRGGESYSFTLPKEKSQDGN